MEGLTGDLKTMNSVPTPLSAISPRKHKKAKTTKFKKVKEGRVKKHSSTSRLQVPPGSIPVKNLLVENEIHKEAEYLPEELKEFKSIKSVLKPRKQFDKDRSYIKIQEMNRIKKEAQLRELK